MDYTAVCKEQLAREEIVWCQEQEVNNVADGDWLTDEGLTGVMNSATFFDKTTIFVRWLFSLQHRPQRDGDVGGPLTVVVSWREAKPVVDAIRCLYTGKEDGVLRPDVKRVSLGPGAGAAARRIKKVLVIVRERFRLRVQNWKEKACAANPNLDIYIATSLSGFFTALASPPSSGKSAPFSISINPHEDDMVGASVTPKGLDRGTPDQRPWAEPWAPRPAAVGRSSVYLSDRLEPHALGRKAPPRARDDTQPIPEPAFLLRTGLGAAAPIVAQVEGQPLVVGDRQKAEGWPIESPAEESAPENLFSGPGWTVVSL